mgnify:CR=1 FL=1
MSDRTTLSGVVETPPRVITTAEGLAVASFRLRPVADVGAPVRSPAGEASAPVLVTALGRLAHAVAEGIDEGDVIVVAGALRLRSAGDPPLTTVDVHAEAIGLDIRRRRRAAVAVGRSGGTAVPS